MKTHTLPEFTSLNVTIVEGYVLPLSPLDVSNPPNFGMAIFIQRDDDATMGSIEPQSLFRLDFADDDAQAIFAIYLQNLEHIGAWKQDDGSWIAYVDKLLWKLQIDVTL